MTGRMTSMSAEAQAWRQEQMERSNDIEGLTPLDIEDQQFADALSKRVMTDEERIAAICDYGRSKDSRIMASRALKKAS